MVNEKYLVESLVSQFKLNLNGLTVYTEAASGAYMLAPILTAVAGAQCVYAETRDSRFGKASEVTDNLMDAACKIGVEDCIQILPQRCHASLGRSDIITNSGFVRPIDKDLINVLKPTAVIPLMWETWEYRSCDFDLQACKDRGILVLGTNEHHPSCDMVGFVGLTGLKLLFELGFDGGNVLVLGSSPMPAKPLVDYLRRLNVEVTWVSAKNDTDLNYKDLSKYLQSYAQRYDILIVAEHIDSRLLIGTGGLISFDTLSSLCPGIKIGHICGNIKRSELANSGLAFLPKYIEPFGFMSYQPYMMGPRPVLTLYAAGLKVGKEMARARLSGLSPREAALQAMINSPAIDFLGELAWV
jgi:hypothetical protein